MHRITRIFQNNAEWVKSTLARDPEFFERSAKGQAPNYLFIGCADSRVPANEITGTGPGEMFVHRNIANQAFPSDLNLLSVLQYAVEVLDIDHIIVCGHYGCGGVHAGCAPPVNGLVDNWLGQIRELHYSHGAKLALMANDEARHHRMVELNVLKQVRNLSRTPVVQHAWARGKRPMLHGFVYDIGDGLLDPLVLGVECKSSADQLNDLWAAAASNRAKLQEAVHSPAR
jgi:carbonic anhydrase